MNESDPVAASAVGPGNLRRLKPHETVRSGDFEAKGRKVFTPWSGPNGFRADAFVKQIYRLRNPQPIGEKK